MAGHKTIEVENILEPTQDSLAEKIAQAISENGGSVVIVSGLESKAMNDIKKVFLDYMERTTFELKKIRKQLECITDKQFINEEVKHED
jgi:predicted Fe-Mo cluster-binding NifX family protein